MKEAMSARLLADMATKFPSVQNRIAKTDGP